MISARAAHARRAARMRSTARVRVRVNDYMIDSAATRRCARENNGDMVARVADITPAVTPSHLLPHTFTTRRASRWHVRR